MTGGLGGRGEGCCSAIMIDAWQALPGAKPAGNAVPHQAIGPKKAVERGSDCESPAGGQLQPGAANAPGRVVVSTAIEARR
jgi:hypothetical protein